MNSTVVETLFKHQTSPWQEIGGAHIEEVIKIIEECNNVLFKKVCADEVVRDRIRARLDAKMDISYEVAREELRRLLSDEREGALLTNNHYFAENLNAARADRWINNLKKMGLKDGQQTTINFHQMKSTLPISNEESAILDIHDTLKAYYKVAIKRFIDNVKVQTIERNLLGPLGPVSIFSPEYVSILDDEEVASIAGEDYATSNRRTDLKLQISRLEKARKICSGKAIKRE